MLNDLIHWPGTWTLRPFFGWLRCAFLHPRSAKHLISESSYDQSCDICGRAWRGPDPY